MEKYFERIITFLPKNRKNLSAVEKSSIASLNDFKRLPNPKTFSDLSAAVQPQYISPPGTYSILDKIRSMIIFFKELKMIFESP